MVKNLLRRRQLLWFSLGLGSAGVAAVASHRYRTELLEQAIAPNAPSAAPENSPSPESLPEPSPEPLPKQMNLPEFQGISQWLNSEPLTVADLKGSVVMVQFWTFGCINCQRTLPYVTRWHQQYAAQGLRIVGVHTPEFAYEREVSRIQAALSDHQIAYPVPLDNEFETWKAYRNRFWPHLFLADRDGIVRYDHIGEGAYEETEQVIRQLLG